MQARAYRLPAMERRRVLVAEDDRELLLLLTAVLRRDGHDVRPVRNGNELLDAIAEHLLAGRHCFDVVITDVQMPGCSGLQALGGIRALQQPIPVILISAYADGDLCSRAEALGATAVFGKPFDIDDLRTALLNVPPTVVTEPPRGALLQ